VSATDKQYDAGTVLIDALIDGDHKSSYLPHLLVDPFNDEHP